MRPPLLAVVVVAAAAAAASGRLEEATVECPCPLAVEALVEEVGLGFP